MFDSFLKVSTWLLVCVVEIDISVPAGGEEEGGGLRGVGEGGYGVGWGVEDFDLCCWGLA